MNFLIFEIYVLSNYIGKLQKLIDKLLDDILWRCMISHVVYMYINYNEMFMNNTFYTKLKFQKPWSLK